jgi:hypothetical protein
VTQSICYDIGPPWVIVHSDVMILNKLYPSALPQIQISLSENILETLVVAVNLASLADEVMPPYLESMDYYR